MCTPLKHSDPIKKGLLLQNGVFCYTYLDDFKKVDERRLPPRECFINDLDQEHISEEKYARAQNIWKTFSCQTLGGYHDIYLKSDVLILTDVFQNFRNFCRDKYGLDPTHFLTGSQLSYAALLKMTGVRLELLSDLDMYNFIELGIRGGYWGVIHRFANANNRYMQSDNSEGESIFLLYIEQNAL